MSKRKDKSNTTQSQDTLPFGGKEKAPPHYPSLVKPTNIRRTLKDDLDDMVSWLDEHEYHDVSKSIWGCGKRSIQISCGADIFNRHHYYTRLYCNAILCPKCGREKSKAHKRRIHRSYEKLAWVLCMGTATLTLPATLRHIDIGDFFRLSSKFLMEYLGIEGCIGYFHPLGDKLNGIHPHIHYLFPIEESRKVVPNRKLRKMSEAWAQLLTSKYPGVEIPERVRVHYLYKDNESVIAASISYHSRKSFIKPCEFNEQEEEVKHYLAELKGKRLVRGYGTLSDRHCKEFIAYTRLVNGRKFNDQKLRTLGSVLAMKVCPICGEKLSYGGSWDGLYRKINYDELIEILPHFYTSESTAEEILEKWGQTIL